LGDLRPRLLDEIEAFFAHYNQQKGKTFKPLDRCGPKKARKIIEHGMAVFLKKQPNGHEKRE
jgi:inorganic pyrophosphatase